LFYINYEEAQIGGHMKVIYNKFKYTYIIYMKRFFQIFNLLFVIIVLNKYYKLSLSFCV
jgi:hypothetical protein